MKKKSQIDRLTTIQMKEKQKLMQYIGLCRKEILQQCQEESIQRVLSDPQLHFKEQIKSPLSLYEKLVVSFDQEGE